MKRKRPAAAQATKARDDATVALPEEDPVAVKAKPSPRTGLMIGTLDPRAVFGNELLRRDRLERLDGPVHGDLSKASCVPIGE